MERKRPNARVVSITRAILTIAGMGVVVMGISVAGQAIALWTNSTRGEPWYTMRFFVLNCAGVLCAGLWMVSSGFRAFVRPTDRTVRAMAFIAAFCLWTWTAILTGPFVEGPDYDTTRRLNNIANLFCLIPATALYLALVTVLYRFSNLPDQRALVQRINAMRRYHMIVGFLVWLGASELWGMYFLMPEPSLGSGALGAFGIPIACFVLYKVFTGYHKRRIRAKLVRSDEDSGEGSVVSPVEPSVAP